MSLDMIKSDQFSFRRSTTYSNQSPKQWKRRTMAVQQGGFLFGSQGTGSYFMEQTKSKDYPAQENVYSIKHPYIAFEVRVLSEEGNGIQYFCLENPMDRGAWLATIHGVAKSQTWLSMHTNIHSKSSLTQTFHLLAICDRNYTKFIFIEGINEVIKEINQSTWRKWNIYLAQLQVH